MIELQRHIEILLLSNDCVIVPDFGGFITHAEPARYDASDKLFLPPLRTLGFNPQLRMNDSILAQSYVEAYDLSFPEALRRIENEVVELKGCLESEGHYFLEDLGELIVNQEGNYEFNPCESGILSPELYGLESFSFKRLKDIGFAEEIRLPKTTAEEAPLPQTTSDEPQLLEFTDDEDNDRIISIKLSWVRNAVAIAAAVVAFFFLATPVTNSNLGTEAMSHLQNSILYKLIPQDTTMPVIAAPVAAETAEKPSIVKETDAQKTADETVEKPKTNITYCIIVASQVKQANAEQYVEKLKKEGYPDAYVYIKNNVVRVVSGEFSSETDAYRVANKMNMQEEFYGAWVYKKVES